MSYKGRPIRRRIIRRIIPDASRDRLVVLLTRSVEELFDG